MTPGDYFKLTIDQNIYYEGLPRKISCLDHSEWCQYLYFYDDPGVKISWVSIHNKCSLTFPREECSYYIALRSGSCAKEVEENITCEECELSTGINKKEPKKIKLFRCTLKLSTGTIMQTSWESCPYDPISPGIVILKTEEKEIEI